MMTNDNSMTKYYKVAGHVMALSAERNMFDMLDNCIPFEVEPCQPLLTIYVDGTNTGCAGDTPPEGWKEEWRQEEEGDEIACGRIGDYSAFIFRSRGAYVGTLRCREDYREAKLTVGKIPKLALDNAMMIAYALATANSGTLLFHASVVSRKGRAYMFLGPSGTGKSTHTRLWLKYIDGTSLLNDDNPVVRLDGDGLPVVYGSPWSGKTPCYKAESYRLGAIVRLRQAPYNRISQMNVLEAYSVMSSSVSGKRWDRSIADGLHATLEAMASTTDVWQMECLPDEAAAVMTSSTI